MTKLDNILFILVVVSSFFCGYQWGKTETINLPVEIEQHATCYDSTKHEAFIAKKNGEYRCFLENREYPHRVRGYNLDYTEELPISGSNVAGEVPQTPWWRFGAL